MCCSTGRSGRERCSQLLANIWLRDLPLLGDAMPTLQAIRSADVHTNADLAVAVKNSASPSSQYNLPSSVFH
jgi:hypothetical protein